MDISSLAAVSGASTQSAAHASGSESTASSSKATALLPDMTAGLDGALHRSASTEWRDWEDALDAFGACTGLAGPVGDATDWEAELGGLDNFLLASADNFLEPFAGPNATPVSPLFPADQDFYYEREQDLSMLEAVGLYNSGADALSTATECELEYKQETPSIEQQQTQMQMQMPTRGDSAVKRHRKRKTTELQRLQSEAQRLANENTQLEKRVKLTQQAESPQQSKLAPKSEFVASLRSELKANEQAEQMYRRRYDILHEILEAWNTGVIEDMEEIADNVYDNDVTLISPDYSDGLRGVEAVMSHWTLLLDTFPDGIMEEYTIQREEANGEKMKATWVFSGTQIYPIFGVQPRHQKVSISGTSFFTFKGDKIHQLVLTWNYREALLKLMGMPSGTANDLVISAAQTAMSQAKMAPAPASSIADATPASALQSVAVQR